MSFELFGYNLSDKESLLKLAEVTICVNPAVARSLAEFLLMCAEEMEASPEWEHKHFCTPDGPALIVFSEDARARHGA